jgi:hypothetical protein
VSSADPSFFSLIFSFSGFTAASDAIVVSGIALSRLLDLQHKIGFLNPACKIRLQNDLPGNDDLEGQSGAIYSDQILDFAYPGLADYIPITCKDWTKMHIDRISQKQRAWRRQIAELVA